MSDDGGAVNDRRGASESVGRPASRVSMATALSRVAGLARESVFAALVGASGEASAFVLAFRIPNLLRDFFAEGALSSAFVPAFAKVRAEEGDERAFLLARRTMGTLGLWTGTIALLGIVFAPAVVDVVAPDVAPAMRSLTISLTRIMFPFLPLVALAAVSMGVLNTHRRYFVPAFAPACFNLVAITGGAVLLALHWDRPERVEQAVTAWSVLAVAGGLAQLLVQVPLLYRVGWRGAPRLDLRFSDPALRSVAKRMAPVVVSLAGTNVMLVIVTALASREPAWPAWLGYAFRLVHLPIGLIGVALGTVVLAAGSRHAARGDAQGLDDLVRRGLRISWLLALPAAVGLFVLAEPILRMLYQRGRFSASDTAAVAGALRAYALGIVFYAGVKATVPRFLARGDTRTPMLCSLGGILVTIALALSTVGTLGHRGLALSVAAGSATNYLLLRLAGRVFGGRSLAVPWRFLLRIGAAAALMGGLGHLVATTWLRGDRPVAGGAMGALLTLGVTLALGTLYLLSLRALGVAEVQSVTRLLRRRRTPPPSPGAVS